MEAHTSSLDRCLEMDVVGTIEGTDKSSANRSCWDYLRHYEAFFSAFRDQPINLLEVGVSGGPSLKLWKWYFPKAQIVGIDIKPECMEYAEDRVSIRIGSQADPAFLDEVCAETPPTIFIDDGSHQHEHNIYTFEHVFPQLLPGGLYIVEDLALHFNRDASRTPGPKTRNAPEYFLGMVRSRMARRPTGGVEAPGPRLFKMIDSVFVVNGAVIIRKRREARDVDLAVSIARKYITKHRMGALAHSRLAEYVLKHDGAPALAEAECEAALKKGGRTLPTLIALAMTLNRQNRHAQAVEIANEAAAIAASDVAASSTLTFHEVSQYAYLARLQVNLGLVTGAIKTLEMVLAKNNRHHMATTMLSRLKAGQVESVS
jgi:hypothetical protein